LLLEGKRVWEKVQKGGAKKKREILESEKPTMLRQKLQQNTKKRGKFQRHGAHRAEASTNWEGAAKMIAGPETRGCSSKKGGAAGNQGMAERRKRE